MLILDLWGISFHAVVVLGLGKYLLFKSILGLCVIVSKNEIFFDNFDVHSQVWQSEKRILRHLIIGTIREINVRTIEFWMLQVSYWNGQHQWVTLRTTILVIIMVKVIFGAIWNISTPGNIVPLNLVCCNNFKYI